MPPNAESNQPKQTEAEQFYAEILTEMSRVGLPFLLAGTYAVCFHTGINRPTKDMDFFVRAGDYPRILAHFQRQGYETEVEDERWLGKIKKGPHFVDVIFNSTGLTAPVADAWFTEAPTARVLDCEVRITPPTEMVFSKCFVQDRYKYDGADVAHLILRKRDDIDWKRLLAYMDPYWEVLLIHVLNFRFIYPSEREAIPRWLFDELLNRLQDHAELPTPQVNVCRGRLFSRRDYLMDVTQWGFADMIGRDKPHEMPHG